MDMIKSTIFILTKKFITPSILSTRTVFLIICFSRGGVLQKAATDNSRTAWNISCSAPETGPIDVKGVTCVAARFSFVFAFHLFGSVRIFRLPIHLLNSRVMARLYYRTHFSHKNQLSNFVRPYSYCSLLSCVAGFSLFLTEQVSLISCALIHSKSKLLTPAELPKSIPPCEIS